MMVFPEAHLPSRTDSPQEPEPPSRRRSRKDQRVSSPDRRESPPWLLALIILLVAGVGVAALCYAYRVELGLVEDPARAAAQPPPDPWAEEFVPIPGGSFLYGCEPQDDKCDGDERPGRDVSVNGFQMMKTDVTTEMYRRCVTKGVCTPPGTKAGCNWNRPERDKDPINCVDVKQADDFCRYVGGGARLPSSEEWEYASKGGSSRTFPWGNEKPTAQRAQFASVSGTTPVGTHPQGASKQGLQDMAGNVYQWTSSRFAPADPANMQVDIRGGAFHSGAEDIRASNRTNMEPTNSLPSIGFRCVR
jgi:formylglycine-generating enzyme required for sulfatase activity